MKIEFRRRDNAPAHHLADVELIFEDSSLPGKLHLRGGSVWARKDGMPGVHIVLPNHEYTVAGPKGPVKRYYQLLQSTNSETLETIRRRILLELMLHHKNLVRVAGLQEWPIDDKAPSDAAEVPHAQP